MNTSLVVASVMFLVLLIILRFGGVWGIPPVVTLRSSGNTIGLRGDVVLQGENLTMSQNAQANTITIRWPFHCGESSIPAHATTTAVSHGLGIVPKTVLVTPQRPSVVGVPAKDGISFTVEISAPQPSPLGFGWCAGE